MYYIFSFKYIIIWYYKNEIENVIKNHFIDIRIRVNSFYSKSAKLSSKDHFSFSSMRFYELHLYYHPLDYHHAILYIPWQERIQAIFAFNGKLWSQKFARKSIEAVNETGIKAGGSSNDVLVVDTQANSSLSLHCIRGITIPSMLNRDT